MSGSYLRRLTATVTLSLVATHAGVAAEPASAATEPGDLWEVTTQMSMEGVNMALPGQKQKVCSSRTWTQPPGGSPDKSCQYSEFTSSPTGATWKMKCSGPPAMAGEGEIKRASADAYTGNITMTSDEGVMTIKLEGRRVGDCDAAASRREVDQMQAQAEQLQRNAASQAAVVEAQTCATLVESMDMRQMKAYESMCPRSKTEPLFCERLATVEGFTTVCPRSEGEATTLEEAAAVCKQDAEAMRQKRCDEALRDESFELLGDCCPEQSSVLAERECAGRDYTSMGGSKYAGFCVHYAQETMAGAQQESASEESTKSKVKKGLKGLFRR